MYYKKIDWLLLGVGLLVLISVLFAPSTTNYWLKVGAYMFGIFCSISAFNEYLGKFFW